jgi:hypothetical protein
MVIFQEKSFIMIRITSCNTITLEHKGMKNMTWTFVLMLILVSLAKILLTCLPTSVVEWILGKFEIHPTLSDTMDTVTIDGKRLEGEEKNQVINHFNQALFLEKHSFPPENSGTPIVIDTKMGKNNVRLFVYCYNDHVDVIKTYKKKEIAYRLRSDSLQKRSSFVTEELV